MTKNEYMDYVESFLSKEINMLAATFYCAVSSETQPLEDRWGLFCKFVRPFGNVVSHTQSVPQSLRSKFSNDGIYVNFYSDVLGLRPIGQYTAPFIVEWCGKNDNYTPDMIESLKEYFLENNIYAITFDKQNSLT